MQRVGKAPYVSFLSAVELEREIAAAGFEIIGERHASRGRDARPFLVARKGVTARRAGLLPQMQAFVNGQ